MAAQPSSVFRADILKGQVVLVTGGGSGIGYEIARQLGLHGAKVMIMGRRQEVLEKAVRAMVADKVDAAYAQGDVRDFASCQNVVNQTEARFGALHLLVNSAAGNFLVEADKLSSKGFRTVLEIDTLGVFNMSTAAFPLLKAAASYPEKSTAIINISATLHKPATWWQSHASAAKAAIDSLTRSFALEWAEFGIRVMGIAPGPIANTGGWSKLGGDADVPMPPGIRVGRTWDIAMLAVFMACPAGHYLSGDTVAADAGQQLYKHPLLPRDMIGQFSRGVESKSRGTGIATTPKLQSKL